MSTFEKVQRGLRDDIAARTAGSIEEKKRWQSVFQRVPPEMHPYASKLLSISKNGRCLTADQVVGAIAATAGKKVETGAQSLFEQGIAEAARLTGMPLPEHVGRTLPGAPKGIFLDPDLIRAGAENARRLLGIAPLSAAR